MTDAIIAAIQMVSGRNVERNLERAGRWVQQAADRGARLVALPENFSGMFGDDAERRNAVSPGGGVVQSFLSETARRHRVWLVGGTIPIRGTSPDRLRATCLLFDDAGRQVARYDKIHLFDVRLPNGETYAESSAFEPGDQVVVADTPFGRVGLAVCYDLRFPELFRRMATQGARMVVVPSAFTFETGRAHWEVLVRARAIENLAYVVAPNQGGRHENGRTTFGHTMIVDAWGSVCGSLAEGEGVVAARLDTTKLEAMRAALPALTHRRLD